jgi:GTP-binding protein
MLIDEVHISVKAGDGGNGIVHFYTDRWRPKGGPDGGNGGKGGDVYFVAVSDISRLQQFRHAKKYSAENGQNGMANQMTGKNGQDLVIDIPVGSVVSYDNGTSFEMTSVGQKQLVAKGGRGGTGNHHFRSATNQTPQQFKLGKKSELKNIFIQLKLIADAGLIGLPNAGKTSLLNELTSANAKVANYAFTTLEPNLGVTFNGKILADIPGLIEGASSGKGLGYRFLKHIERTKLLVHCLSVETQDPVADYQIIRQELTNYSSSLAQKPEILILTKSDLATDEQLKEISDKVHPSLIVNIADDNSLKELLKLIDKNLT